MHSGPPHALCTAPRPGTKTGASVSDPPAHLDELALHVAHRAAHVVAVRPELPLHLRRRRTHTISTHNLQGTPSTQ